MEKIANTWAGRAYGTNTGNIFLEINKLESVLKGTLHFNDDRLGIVVYRVVGSLNDEFKLRGTPTQPTTGVNVEELDVVATLNDRGELKGRWSTPLGAAGTLHLFPHDAESPEIRGSENTLISEQLHVMNIQLGTIQLFYDDLEKIFSKIQEDFLHGKLIIAHDTHKGVVTKYVEDFLKTARQLGTLTYFKATIQEHEVKGINKVVILELRASGSNEITVQGAQESWVVGKAETVAAAIRQHQKPLITSYKKFGLGLNQIVFVLMIVAMPSISDWSYRMIFAISVVALLAALLWVHTKWIPNASVVLGTGSPNWVNRNWLSILSWVGGILSAVIAAKLVEWLANKP